MANLHQDIVFSIIVRLPAKSILRFRCVSKAWCKLLKDPKFLKKHLKHAIEMNRFSVMLLSFSVPFCHDESTDTYTLAYDPSLCTLSNPVAINYPLRNANLGITIWGICNGLICGSPVGEYCVVLWNPATKEFKKVPTIPIESANESAYPEYALGYGDEIDDFKVVSFVRFEDESFCEVQVYTLKSNSWRRLENIPHELCPGLPEMAQASVNGATHWLSSTDSRKHEVIASFDFKNERVHKMQLPSFCSEFAGTRLCSLGGSLCLHGSIDGRTDVWEMKEYGVTGSWAKLFTFKQDTIFQSSTQSEPLQFVKNGEVLLGYDTDVGYQLDLHDIKRGTSRNLKAYAKQVSYYGKYASTSVYVESLVPLNSGTYVGLPGTEEPTGSS